MKKSLKFSLIGSVSYPLLLLLLSNDKDLLIYLHYPIYLIIKFFYGWNDGIIFIMIFMCLLFDIIIGFILGKLFEKLFT